ncbi:response regulator [Paenibacillus sp.]|uniref:response regulator transcription factor n=1 Tax=Paenibacillus sp. TaxID=58172 RepID=UPI0028117C82|nr:helix-turn-helix domain-containing protein [Paenibacillus sp.]
MIRTILVDDEMLARNYIRGLVDWERHGFDIVGEASNGFEALTLIEEVSPQLVLADIHMAGMDGVALCKRLSELGGDVRTIVLSSYDNYDYVRETLRHGAVDYLLKHRVDGPGLTALLTKVKDEIERSNRLRREETYLEKHWKLMNLELSRKYAKDLALGTEEELGRAIQYFANLSPIGARNLMLGVMQLANYALFTEQLATQEKMKLSRSVADLCHQQFDELNGIVSDLEQGKFLFLFSFEREKSEYAMRQRLHACTQRIERSLLSLMNVKAVFGAFQPMRDVEGVRAVYERADASLAEKQQLRWIDVGASAVGRQPAFTLGLGEERELQLALERGDEAKTRSLLRGIFEAIRSRGATVQSIQLTVGELVSLAEKVWRKSGGKEATFYEGAYLTRSDLSRADRLDDIRNWTLSLFDALLGKLPRDLSDEGDSAYVKAAKSFVRRHYRDNVSLEHAAEHAGITASYLSRLFKQQAGVNFTEYLNQVRIEQAKQLIRDGQGTVKMKQIYKDVGFSSYNYFFKVFKDIVGMTPNSYANGAERRESGDGEAR